MTRPLLLAAAFALAACARSAPNAPTAASIRGKPAAPVEIEARLSDGGAALTLRFGAPARGVAVEVSGVDGLVVAGPPALAKDASFDHGATAAYEVAFTPGPGRSALAVAVTGTFAGQPRAWLVTFPVGEPAAPAPRPASVDVQPDGERVKALPAAPTPR
jgi:hypothetical protein